MNLLLNVFCVFMLIHGVQMQFPYDSPQLCLKEDVNDGVCSVIENFFGFTPFQQFVDVLAGALTPFTTIFQIQDIISYVTRSFAPNPVNTTNYESISKSFNLILFHPNSNTPPPNISSTEVLMSCDVLNLNGNPVKLAWSGYGHNCYGANATETFFDWATKDMQRYSDISNSSIIVVDWGFAGLSCYGYIQITLCLIEKIADFFAFILSKCVIIEELDLVGHSMGAQIIGYIAQHLKASGRQVRTAIGLDPAGPGYERGLRCQGIETGCANYSMVFHSNPCQLGTCDFSFGDVNVLLNPFRSYCQPGCTCFLNPSCSHSYATNVFLKLTQNAPIPATYTSSLPIIPGWGETTTLTIYETMKSGFYVLDTYN